MKTDEFSLSFSQDIWGYHLARAYQHASSASEMLHLSFDSVYTAPCSCFWINVGCFLLWRTHSVSFTHTAKPFFLVSHTGNQHSPFWRHQWPFTVHKFFSGSHRSRPISYWRTKIIPFQKTGQFLLKILFVFPSLCLSGAYYPVYCTDLQKHFYFASLKIHVKSCTSIRMKNTLICATDAKDFSGIWRQENCIST